MKDDNTKIVVYFENLPKNHKICVPVEGYKAHAVALQKPSSVVLYDYYATDRKVTSYYAIDSTLCDLCENDEDCIKSCK